jgi:hypothetical protein
MRRCVGLFIGCGGLLAGAVGDARAQSSPPPQTFGNPQQYLSGPNQAPRSNDDVRNLGAPPSPGPIAPNTTTGPSRELTQRERRELLQNGVRDDPSPPPWNANRDRK